MLIAEFIEVIGEKLVREVFLVFSYPEKGEPNEPFIIPVIICDKGTEEEGQVTQEFTKERGLCQKYEDSSMLFS